MPTDILPDPPVNRARHTLIDDIQGLAFGSFMAAVGVVLLRHMGFVTGQIAGLALLLSYVTGLSFGLLFFVLNLPFYWLGYRRFGANFTIKSLIAVTALSLLSQWLPTQIAFGSIQPAVGAVLIGVITGTALLALFRHGASLGGIGVVGLYVQDATGFRAGWVQLIFDACLFAAALLVMPWPRVAWSFLGAAVVNLVIAINHRRDRYQV